MTSVLGCCLFSTLRSKVNNYVKTLATLVFSSSFTLLPWVLDEQNPRGPVIIPWMYHCHNQISLALK